MRKSSVQQSLYHSTALFESISPSHLQSSRGGKRHTNLAQLNAAAQPHSLMATFRAHQLPNAFENRTLNSSQIQHFMAKKTSAQLEKSTVALSTSLQLRNMNRYRENSKLLHDDGQVAIDRGSVGEPDEGSFDIRMHQKLTEDRRSSGHRSPDYAHHG